MRIRPAVAISASLALLGAGPVLAAAGDAADRPAAGAASSTLTLLDVALGGNELSVLQLDLRSSIVDGAPTTSFVVTPLALDGTTYGRQSLSSRSAVLPAVDSASAAPAALTAVGRARSPQIDVRSERGTSSAGAASLGAVSVLGMPLRLDGSTSISSVVDGAGAVGGKTLSVTNMALPSLADLVAALGLDLTELPTTSLTDLLGGLDLGTPATDAAQAVLDEALAAVQPQVDAAEAAVADAGQAVESATEQLADAQAALAPVTKALNDASGALTGTTAGLRVGSLIGGLPGVDEVTETITEPVVEVTQPLEPAPAPVELIDEVEAVVEEVDPVLDPVLDTVVETAEPVLEPVEPVVEQVAPLPQIPLEVPAELQPLVDAYNAAKQAYDEALADVTDAQALLDAANQLLADAQAALDALLAPYQPQIDALVDAVLGVLDTTPLVALDRLEVTTRSGVTSAAAGGQTAEVVAGEIDGLRVLGTDVLEQAVGSSAVEVLDLTDPVQARLDAAMGSLTGTVSTVLSQVPGLPGLDVPAPTVELLNQATVTDVRDGFGIAGSALRALTVTWPGITIPAAAAVPGASSLPAVTGIPTLSTSGGALRTSAVGDVLTQPLTLGIATLEDRARFRPSQQSLQPGDGTDGTGGGAPGDGTTGGGTPGTGTPGTGTPGADGPGEPGTAIPDGPGGSTPPGTTTSNPRTPPVGLTQLPRTGADTAPAVLALLLVAGALGLHRRYGTT